VYLRIQNRLPDSFPRAHASLTMGARGPKSAASLAVVPPRAAPVPVVTGTKPPAHLSEEAREWWQSVTRDFDLEPHHLKLLQAACEAWDRMTLAREAVANDGITFRAANGDLKSNPAVAIERDARTAFARLVRELDLDAGALADRRPPSLSSNRWGRGNAG
jgi:P27 family predicted phage terminase small subunit